MLKSSLDYKKETLKTYKDNSKEYAGKFDGAFKYHEKSLERFLSKLKPNSEIIDLGAGAGTYATKMQDAGHYVVCLDNSVEMLNICSQRKLNTLLMDMENMDLGKRVFDAGWAMTAITHTPKYKIEDLFKKIGEGIKHQGILFVGVHQGSENDLKEDIPGSGYFRHMSKFIPGEVEKLSNKYFTTFDNWETEGYGGVKFLNYLMRKNLKL
ncbi:MAG TPA: class I SAM-dependent methyltransferase [Alphaproteobacteria bacterium]|nr:class I SAM-dependent methyltransferase [Alphaproteobacteria bacterium]